MSFSSIMMIAGEASGDMHGARLASSIKKRFGNPFLFGVGSDAMHAAGVRLLVDAKELAVVGITEVISKLPTIYRAMGTVKKALRNLRPDLLILIDFPDFNFRVAAIAKQLNIPVLYYISPQIWAWRQGRVSTIKRLVDHMAVILPFEASFYRKHNVPVTFVGHPLLDGIPTQTEKPLDRTEPEETIIGLLPGSRGKEVATLLPAMLEAARLVKQRMPSVKFLVSCSPSIDAALLESIVDPFESSLDVQIVKGDVASVFKQSRMLVAASGTVTLEAALNEIPTVIVYKVSPLSYWLGKRLIKVNHIGIANLIARKELFPELIQENATPAVIAETTWSLLNDKKKFNRIKAELADIRGRLGGAGASDRVAAIAMDLIRRS